MRPIQQYNKIIAVKTSWSESLGMGHIQRMSSLVWYLNEYKYIKAYLIVHAVPKSFPAELNQYIRNEIDMSPDMIIRDMRDSSKEEIVGLKEAAKVIVIDDHGPGRLYADHAIDILPHSESSGKALRYNNFIYGYNFLKSLSLRKDKVIKKNIDFVIYPGNSPSGEYIDFLTGLLPRGSSYAVLKYNDSYLLRDGIAHPLKELSHAEIILSARVVLSHFGITLYEGFISGCRLISINPTEYHSGLSDSVKKDLNLVNLGVYNEMDKDAAVKIIGETARTPLSGIINAVDVYNRIIDGLEGFFKLIMII